VTDEQVERNLVRLACRRVVPFLNGTARPRRTRTQSDYSLKTLWDEGFVPASRRLITDGVPPNHLKTAMNKFKRLLGIVEPDDLIFFPATLQKQLINELKAEVANEEPLATLRLDERVVSEISEFRVEMWSNESQHAGRPHVRVHLKNGIISVSLDPEPVNLTPRGGLIGEASALKVIKKYLKVLLDLWYRTRPDTQKLTARNYASNKIMQKRRRHR
jgi:hypothetical protein